MTFPHPHNPLATRALRSDVCPTAHTRSRNLANPCKRVHAAVLPTVADRGTAKTGHSRWAHVDSSLLLRHLWSWRVVLRKSQLPNNCKGRLSKVVYKAKDDAVHTIIVVSSPPAASGFPLTRVQSRIPFRFCVSATLKWLQVQSWRSTKTFSGGRPSLQASLADHHSLESPYNHHCT